MGNPKCRSFIAIGTRYCILYSKRPDPARNKLKTVSQIGYRLYTMKMLCSDKNNVCSYDAKSVEVRKGHVGGGSNVWTGP